MLTTRSFHVNAKVPRIGSPHNAHAYANIATQSQPVIGPKVFQRVEKNARLYANKASQPAL